MQMIKLLLPVKENTDNIPIKHSFRGYNIFCFSGQFSSHFVESNLFTYIDFAKQEPEMSSVMRKKKHFAYAKTKTQISFTVAAKLISAFVFATR